MRVIQSNESFKLVEGGLQFQYVKGIIRHQNVLYAAKWNSRRELPVDFSELHDVKQLDTEDRGPRMQPDWTVAEEQDCYVKTPNLLAYAEAPNLENLILQEIETCEILRKHPHPNIALYYGCRETRGRASGLCFKRYTTTLASKVDPQHLNKSAFLSSGRPYVDDKIKQALGGIKEAINHIHSLGIVHNDITPANIMLDEDGTMVLIDFDSCRHIGEELRGKDGVGTKRTYPWHNPEVTISSESNDLDAFTEVETWLFGTSADDFLFKP